MSSRESAESPMCTTLKLSKDEDEVKMEEKKYCDVNLEGCVDDREDPAERMDSNEFILVQGIPILEKGNYGHWKMKMRASIRGISEDAWIAVKSGWSSPTTLGEDKTQVPKTKSLWTVEEKQMAKYNAKALSAIFNAVNKNQFKRIQCCESAKEAWDKLEKIYEGTTNVQRSRLDMLASRFETITMEDHETIEEFTGKLSSIANEAQHMGKKYKDKKLVKKLMRSLPAKFDIKKTAM